MAAPQLPAVVWIHPSGSVTSAQRKIWSARMPKVANVTLATSATDASITHVVWSAESASPDVSIAWYKRFESGNICAVTPAWMINALKTKQRPSAAMDIECAWVESTSSAKRARTLSSSPTDDELLPLPPRSVMIGDVEIFGHSFGTLPLFVGYTGQYEAASAPAQVLADLTAAFAAASEVTSGSTLLIDTADAYSAPNTLNRGEQVIAAALLAKTTPSTVIATKGGMRRVGPLSRDWETVDLSPDAVKRTIRASHAALNTGVAVKSARSDLSVADPPRERLCGDARRCDRHSSPRRKRDARRRSRPAPR